MNKLPVKLFLAGFLSVVLAGCVTTQGNVGQMSNYAVPIDEAEWIRNGEPIEFEGELWYPQDGFDVFLDNEVLKLEEYKGVEFFVDRTDVRPYNRLYTKFDRNKFRYFEKKTSHD